MQLSVFLRYATGVSTVPSAFCAFSFRDDRAAVNEEIEIENDTKNIVTFITNVIIVYRLSRTVGSGSVCLIALER